MLRTLIDLPNILLTGILGSKPQILFLFVYFVFQYFRKRKLSGAGLRVFLKTFPDYSNVFGSSGWELLLIESWEWRGRDVPVEWTTSSQPVTDNSLSQGCIEGQKTCSHSQDDNFVGNFQTLCHSHTCFTISFKSLQWHQYFLSSWLYALALEAEKRNNSILYLWFIAMQHSFLFVFF